MDQIVIPRIPFYFVRHGETDWNKTRQGLCPDSSIPLNATGITQATQTSVHIAPLGIDIIYSSPLKRAHQTAEIINSALDLDIVLHEGLANIKDHNVAYTLLEILDPQIRVAIVSHGEVYRILLRILNIETPNIRARNAGLYLFKPSEEWEVVEIT